MELYDLLTEKERNYCAYDSITKQDINEECNDIDSLISYLVPLYGRNMCDEMVNRLSKYNIERKFDKEEKKWISKLVKR